MRDYLAKIYCSTSPVKINRSLIFCHRIPGRIGSGWDDIKTGLAIFRNPVVSTSSMSTRSWWTHATCTFSLCGMLSSLLKTICNPVEQKLDRSAVWWWRLIHLGFTTVTPGTGKVLCFELVDSWCVLSACLGCLGLPAGEFLHAIFRLWHDPQGFRPSHRSFIVVHLLAESVLQGYVVIWLRTYQLTSVPLATSLTHFRNPWIPASCANRIMVTEIVTASQPKLEVSRFMTDLRAKDVLQNMQE